MARELCLGYGNVVIDGCMKEPPCDGFSPGYTCVRALGGLRGGCVASCAEKLRLFSVRLWLCVAKEHQLVHVRRVVAPLGWRSASTASVFLHVFPH